MKIIFLDFDGVITTVQSHWKLDPEKMKLLKEVCDSTGAKIVVSSSWRRRNLKETIEFITQEGFFTPIPFISPDLVIGITDRMYAFSFSDKDRHFLIPRGVEIQHWLERSEETIDSYVILDDDPDMLYEQRDHFVQTDPICGITEEDVKKAINILNSKQQ